MRVTRLSWTPFRLPLRAPFSTAMGEMTHREGLILRLETDAELSGLGEASPHPAAGPDAARELDTALAELGPSLVGAELASLHAAYPDAPSPLRCAVDVAACDALARERGVSLARLLVDQPRPHVAVNATVSVRENAEAAAEARAAREDGFDCVKLKVGMASDVGEEKTRVAYVRAALGPNAKLRIDANGAWDAAQAVRTIQALKEYNLEFVEQPIAAGNLEAMRDIQRIVQTPVAADEDVTGPDTARRIVETGAARILVVKPMVVGGVRPAREIAEIASSAGLAVVITTTIDAGVGTAAALHLAATLPTGSLACGLATSSLLADDLIARPLAVHAGQMVLPQGPGLGVELDEAKLERYGGSERTVT